MMTIAPAMVMRHALVAIVRRLITIAVKMSGALLGNRNAFQPFEGMRR